MEKMKDFLHQRIEQAGEEELRIMCIMAGRIIRTGVN